MYFKKSTIFTIFTACFFSTALFSYAVVLPTPKEPFKDKAKAADENLLKEAISETHYIHSHGVEWDARLIISKGQILLKPAKSDHVTRHNAGTELPLENGDVIRLYPKAEVEIRLYDKAIFKIFENSEIQIVSLNKTDTLLSLRYGSLVGKVKHFLDKTHKIKIKTIYTNSAIDSADFALGYSKQSKTTGVAVFDTGVMSVSTINEEGLSLGLYELKGNKEIVYSAALPDIDEEGHVKSDPNYKMKDIDIKPQKISQMQYLLDEQEKIRPVAMNLYKEWHKYAEGERAKVRKEVLSQGEKMISSFSIQSRVNDDDLLDNSGSTSNYNSQLEEAE